MIRESTGTRKDLLQDLDTIGMAAQEYRRHEVRFRESCKEAASRPGSGIPCYSQHRGRSGYIALKGLETGGVVAHITPRARFEEYVFNLGGVVKDYRTVLQERPVIEERIKLLLSRTDYGYYDLLDRGVDGLGHVDGEDRFIFGAREPTLTGGNQLTIEVNGKGDRAVIKIKDEKGKLLRWGWCKYPTKVS